MAFEMRPDGTVVLIQQEENYNWLNGRPDKEAILAHAYATGAAIPRGLHVDQFGNSRVDDKGVRHTSHLITGDAEIDNANFERFASKGFTVKSNKAGTMFDVSIPQEKFEQNLKDQVAAYEKHKNAGKNRRQNIPGGDPTKDFYEEKRQEASAANLSVDELLSNP